MGVGQKTRQAEWGQNGVRSLSGQRVLHLVDLRFRVHSGESANVHIRAMESALSERVEVLTPGCPLAVKVLRAVSHRGRPRGAARLVEAAGLFLGVLEMCGYVLLHPTRFVYARHAMSLTPVLLLLRILRRPIVLEVNALSSTEWRITGQRKPGPTSRFEPAVLRLASKIRCVSGRLAREVAEAGVMPDRIFVEHNGVDETLLNPADSREMDRATGQLVGFIGSGRSWHQIPTLLDAFEIVANDVPGARLVMAGPGVADLEKDVAARGLKENVEILGSVSHPDALALLRRVTIAVSPGSAPHHSPLKLFEAMALGKPIVAGRAEGVCEILENETSAILVEQGDAVALAAAIVRLLRDPELRRRIGSEAREKARGRTWTRVADAVIRAGEEAASRAEGGR